ncbi:hypothetical protein [Acinetobacter venetianus]|uniref:hypothetical protein n=1 Tax=Acinetobacter venetianus TaxID=52133 RepID=UPI003A95CBED
MFNKNQTKAVELLNYISNCISKKEQAIIEKRDINIIERELKINFWNLTTPNSKIKSFVKGKDKCLLKIKYYNPASGHCQTYRYFDFQIKEKIM